MSLVTIKVTIKRGRLAAVLAVACAATLAATACSATAQPGSAGPSAAASAPSHPAARPFPVAENNRPGTSAWRITDLGAPDAIDGYADQQSVLPGQSFRLYVSTTAKSFQVKAFRFGWYQGHQARLVWTSKHLAGRQQTAENIASGTHMVTTPWRPSLTVTTTGWASGSYLLRLDASSGAERYVPITVRSASTAGAVVILNDNTTWQAYNTWGGYSLYQGPDGLPRDRGYAVSFDRPYDGDGAVRFLAFDQAAIALAEKTGVPLAYETDVDIDQHPGILARARAVITLGHDEYYSIAMRHALLQARNVGTNLAFLGANAIYRHIRFADGDRVIICYKAAAIDPLFGTDNADTTQQWRDPPDPRPESVITGVFYECNPVSAPWVVYDPSSWIFQGTGAYQGERFAGLVGPEYDRLNPSVPFPRPMQVLAHSPLTCDGFSTFSDSVYYTVASGAGVFASGTMRWVCAMRGPHCGHGLTRAAERFVDRATQNLLRAFAAGPAGRIHPAQDNVARVKPPRIAALYDGVRLMDDIDARIVAFLVRDARASYALIGGEIGLSAPAVKRRVDRLRAAGAITGFSARVDPAAMGWTTEAYVELYCGGRTSPEEIGAAVRRYPEVVDACTITGEADALVHIRARDVRHFEDVMERIRAESFVVRTKSVIVLSRLVDRADALAPLR